MVTLGRGGGVSCQAAGEDFPEMNGFWSTAGCFLEDRQKKKSS